jgi:hypothetical protein
MADGGAMGALAMNPALVGRPAVNAPVAAPGKPSMAARRQAMMAKKPMPSAMMAKEGGKAETHAEMKADMSQDKAMVKKAMKQHDAQEHKGGVGTKLKLKHGGKMNTGGVVNGQGGFKTGGVIKANGGGYKKGGSAKKHFATGGKVSSGAPVAIKQKPAAKPIRINELTGTYKKGGSVARKAMGGGMDMSSSEGNYGYPGFVPEGANVEAMNGSFNSMPMPNMTPGFTRYGEDGSPEYVGAMPVDDINTLYGRMLGRAPDPTGIAANRGASADTIRQSIMRSPEFLSRDSGMGYAPMGKSQLVTAKKGGKVAHKQYGGIMSESDSAKMDAQDRAYQGHYDRLTQQNLADSKAVDDALMYLPRKAMQGMGYLKDKLMGPSAVSDAERRAMQQIKSKGVGAISDREREASTTVIPARRRGGAMKK